MKGVYIQTFGCQMNSSDSDRMEAVLAPLNYEKVGTPQEADLVLINTCSIREKAENKLTSFAKDLGFKFFPSTDFHYIGCLNSLSKKLRGKAGTKCVKLDGGNSINETKGA